MPKRSKKTTSRGASRSSNDVDTQEVRKKSRRTRTRNRRADSTEFIERLELEEIKEEVASDIELDDDSSFPHLTTNSRQEAPNVEKLPFQCDLCHCRFSAQFEFFEHLKSHYDMSQSAQGTSSGGSTAAQKPSTSRSRNQQNTKKTLSVVLARLTETERPDLPKRSHKKAVTSNKRVSRSRASDHFPCTICRRKFSDRMKLSKHLKDSHKTIEQESGTEPISESQEDDSGTSRRKSRRTIRKPAKFDAEESAGNEVENPDEPRDGEDDDVDYILPDDLDDRDVDEEIDADVDTDVDADIDADFVAEEENEADDETEKICSACGELCASQNKLNIHISVEHPDIDLNGHLCSACGKIFPTNRKRKFHLKKEHPEMAAAEAEEESKKPRTRRKGNYSCKECGRCFQHRNSLSYHVKGHTGVRDFVCKTCNKAFFAGSALKVHMRIHTGVKPYGCEKCGRMFRQWGDLAYHMTSIHSDLKKFQCEYCGKDFARKYSLTVHRRMHTKENNYSCEFCEKSFRASSYLQNHRRIHTGEKPYKCEICEKPFRVKSDMKRHVVSHSRQEEIRITDAAGVTTTIQHIPRVKPPRKPKSLSNTKPPKPKTKPKPKSMPTVHNLVAVDESGQIIPLEPNMAKQLRAGQVIQVPVSTSSTNQITTKNSKTIISPKKNTTTTITSEVPENTQDFPDYEEDDYDDMSEEGGEDQGTMYVWPVFMS